MELCGEHPLEAQVRIYLPLRYKNSVLPHNPADATLGIRLRYLRNRLRVTITQFASRARLGYNTIARLERNEIKKPRPWVLARIVQTFEKDIATLLPESADLFEWAIPPKRIPDLMRHVRLKQGLSQTGLARLLGVSRISVYRYERGRICPGTAVLERLKNHFGIDWKGAGRGQ